ncbi:gluconokinase [Limnohabitans sp. Jir72]|uniref:gluconokinase n=1 Tax=Limnohabitans sp. Jir72 TaxID=1977909 RepID=UPI000D3B00B1|nr:gluconokinase [Limnohabitans sp. Jir72]PUE26497.1 gluconokinase [Limnohabitans sp. Jir72]
MSTTPMRLIVMGVSGCGKSTMAAALSQSLGLEMVDGDDLHAPESVAKMRSGIALQDADRWPWLDRIGAYLSQPHPQGRVVACSALKRAYRDRIREQAGDVCFVFLDGDFELIDQRMRQRVGHYMQPGLLDSQFSTLEIPQADEPDVIRLPITEPVHDMVTQALAALQARTSSRLHPAL